MKKKLEDLVENFKKKEMELLEILKITELDFDENQDKSVIKKKIKDYIKNLNKAKKVFNEYESLATEIEDITSDDGESAELSKAVVELREDEFAVENVQLEYEKVDLKKKPKSKKKQKDSVKEL